MSAQHGINNWKKENNEPHRRLAARCRAKFHLDAHIAPNFDLPDERFDFAAFCRSVLATGADSVCMFAKCHYGYSYYPTTVGHPHPKLKIDLMGNLVREFKRQRPDLPVMIYYNLRFSPVDNLLHPEWVIQAADNASSLPREDHIQNESLWRLMCFNGPYGGQARAQFLEIAERYPIDGFFIDFSRSPGACFCRACRERYRQETGHDLPAPGDIAEIKAYSIWSRQVSDNFIEELARQLHKIRPEIALGSNHCYGLKQPLRVPEAIGYLTEDVVERNQMRGCMESMSGRYYCSLPVPTEIMTTRMIHWWLDWGFKTDDELLLQNAIVFALGLRADLSDEVYPNYQIPARVLSAFKKVFAHGHKISELMKGAESHPDLLVLHSASTFYSDDRPANDSDEMSKCVRGMHLVLVQSNHHYQFVNETYLPDWLGKVSTLILPSQSVLDRDTQDLIRSFVRDGGTVIAIGATVLNKGLEDLFGVLTVGAFDKPNQFLMAKPFLDYEGSDFPLQVYEKAYRVKADQALVISRIQERILSGKQGPWMDGYPLGPCEWPGITEHTYGKGKAVVIACPVDLSMFERYSAELRQFVLEIIRAYHPAPFVDWKSSETVELTHFVREGRSLVHLIHHPVRTALNVPYVIGRIEPLREFEIRFRLPERPAAVWLDRENQPVDWSYKDGLLTVIIFNLHIHAVLMIDHQQRRA